MECRHVYIVHEDRQAWAKRQAATGLARPGLSEMAYFLFARVDIDDLVADMAAYLEERSVQLSIIDIAQIAQLANLSDAERRSTLLWNITDGSGVFSGSHVPAFARLLGIQCFGNSALNQLLSQDKFKTLLMCDKLQIPHPPSVLAAGKRIVAGDPASLSGDLFVKPSCLDNKIGLFADSQASTIHQALEISERIYNLYGDRAIIQNYIVGQDLRVSFLNVFPELSIKESLALYWSEERNELRRRFTSYEDHFSAFRDWDANGAAKPPEDARDGIFQDPKLGDSLRNIEAHVELLVEYLALRDYFGIDFRIGSDRRVWFMELNTAPFLRYRGLKDFIARRHGLEFGAAVGRALLNAFSRFREPLPIATL